MKTTLKLASVALLLLSILPASAATKSWVGNTSADWDLAGNWLASGVPAVGDTVIFNSSTAANTTLTISTATSSLLNLVFSGSPAGYVIGTTSGNILTVASAGSISTATSVANAQTINAPLVFGGANYSFNSNAVNSSATLNFGGTLTGVSGGTTLTLGGSNTGLNTITGAIANNGTTANGLNLVKSGTGTWVLAGANTYTGSTTLQGGTLILDYTSNAANKLGASATSVLILGGANLVLNGGSGAEAVASTRIYGGGQTTITRTSLSTQTISLGQITASFSSGNGGSVTAVNFQSGVAYTSNTTGIGGNATGSLLNSNAFATVGTQGAADWASVNSSGAIVAYSDVNTYLTLAASSSPSTSSNFVVKNSLATSQTQLYTLKITTDANAGATPTLTLNTTLTLGAHGGILDSASSTATYLITGGAIALGASGTSIQQYGNGALQIDSQILGSNAIYFQKAGPGTLILSGNNAWKQTFTIQQGTVSVASDANLGGNHGSVTIGTFTQAATLTQSSLGLTSAAPSTLVLGSSMLGWTVTGISADRMTVTLSGSLSSAMGSVGYAVGGSLVLNGGTLQATDTFTMAETADATTINRGVALGNDGGTFEVVAGKTLTTPGVVSNLNTAPGSLTKTGSGALVLSGANTYTGGTSIAQGKLLANNTSGSATGTGAVALGAATLAGTGTVSGLVTTSGVTSVIGSTDAVGTLRLTAGLDASNGATLDFQLGPTSDLLSISGVFTGSTAANGLHFTFEDAGGITAGTVYTLMTFTSSSGFDSTDILVSLMPAGWTLDSTFGTDGNGFNITATSLQVRFSTVPEPSTYLLMGLGGLMLLLSRLSMRKRVA